ncbi:dihydrodipicolinate synthase family protein [Pandoraea anhela]|uniref:Dihydrodipicolinate synthase family protein n=1 Tax=Pandoraea anhela TaxID=2508295 RepID=A0A5E4WBM7_9BURK|nr:dihydrodipicolinate synthase family protein [Pandoraea anhela]VVE22407.1 dihydrodipicolinate synthase family protein [Pandoraea anhela]
MSAAHRPLAGVLCPVITPFTETLVPDTPRFLRQCRWLLENDVGLAVFGTNSEGNSLSVQERIGLLHAMADAGIPMSRVLAGTGACSLSDAVTLTNVATALGCAGVLMLPPFYYKTVSDDGLFAFYAEVLAGVKRGQPAVYLYHIPGVANIGFSHELIARLIGQYPGVIRGIKDTGGDPSQTRDLLASFASEDFAVFPGNESDLVKFMEAGAAGCISATANVNPKGLVALYRSLGSPEAGQMQARADAIRAAFAKHPMIPALKAALAWAFQDDNLLRVRPPLMALSQAQREQLVSALISLDFQPPVLREALREAI